MKNLFSLLTLLAFFGCTHQQISDYALEKPVLNLEEFFNGKMKAYGYFADRSGRVKKRFTVFIDASWVGLVGTLKEDFIYNDGTTSQRIWTLTKVGENKYEGSAADVEGKAVGETAGNAFQFKYYLNLEVDGSTYKVFFDDWMYLMNAKTMLNKSIMSKWGFRLGEVVLVFQK